MDMDDENTSRDMKYVKGVIKKFISDNYKGVSKCKISKSLADDGVFVVDCRGDLEVKNKFITSLTNEYFRFGKVAGGFDCSYCASLISLKGAPSEVGGDFTCSNCYSLESLEDGPSYVGASYDCASCRKIVNLKGVPNFIPGDFYANHNESLLTLEGGPITVGGYFNCSNCAKLTSLKGGPQKVGDYFSCLY